MRRHRRGGRDAFPGGLEERGVRRRRGLPEPAVARDVALGEADDRRAPFGRARDGVLHDRDGFLGRRRIPHVRESDADGRARHGSARR